jgi:RNA polymerase sigma factor (TIGR02999 family)
MNSQAGASNPDRGGPIERLLPSVYEELRKLAEDRLRHEPPGQTLQATALVHEVYARLAAGHAEPLQWENRGHLFAAAAEAMRRILVEQARRKRNRPRGEPGEAAELVIAAPEGDGFKDLVLVDAALTRFESVNLQAANLVRLRYFAGLPVDQAAAAMGVSERTAARLWTFARAWLYREMKADFEKVSESDEILAVSTDPDSH